MIEQKKDPYADPEGIVTSPNDLQCSASTVILVKQIADLLERNFPGWLWTVQPDERGGVINVFSWRLSGTWGYRIKTKNIQNDPQLKLALIAGGEILERFGQRRGPYDYSRWKAQKNRFGLKDFDITDKSRQMQRHRRDEDFTDAVRQGRIKLHIEDRKTATGTYRQLFVQPSALWERDR